MKKKLLMLIIVFSLVFSAMITASAARYDTQCRSAVCGVYQDITDL